MDVEVIDVKTGAVRKMPERFAKILVGLKHVRWPEQTNTELAFPGTDDSRTIYDIDVEIKAENSAIILAVDPADNVQNPEPQPAIIKRGRKPKFRG